MQRYRKNIIYQKNQYKKYIKNPLLVRDQVIFLFLRQI